MGHYCFTKAGHCHLLSWEVTWSIGCNPELNGALLFYKTKTLSPTFMRGDLQCWEWGIIVLQKQVTVTYFHERGICSVGNGALLFYYAVLGAILNLMGHYCFTKQRQCHLKCTFMRGHDLETWTLTFTTHRDNSANHKLMTFFSLKKILLFPEHRLWKYLQIISIGDIHVLHEISKLTGIFWERKETIFQYVVCWKFYTAC